MNLAIRTKIIETAKLGLKKARQGNQFNPYNLSQLGYLHVLNLYRVIEELSKEGEKNALVHHD